MVRRLSPPVLPEASSMAASGKTGRRARDKIHHRATHDTSAATSHRTRATTSDQTSATATGQTSASPGPATCAAAFRSRWADGAHRHLRKGCDAGRGGANAPNSPAAVLGCLTAEISELAGNADGDKKKMQIPHPTPPPPTSPNSRHLQPAIHSNEDFNKLLEDVIISQGGVVPNIQPKLLTNKTSTPSWQKVSTSGKKSSQTSKEYGGNLLPTTSTQSSPPHPSPNKGPLNPSPKDLSE
ncbi:uncharacterized protein LOC123617099 [Camelus bactrianus]|uniref:Uncharacterized protein LOC123617099 n=1 Tax=Camelus bactrianus TaxID=9837 RepID=A0A9W3G778_CAMBA